MNKEESIHSPFSPISFVLLFMTVVVALGIHPNSAKAQLFRKTKEPQPIVAPLPPEPDYQSIDELSDHIKSNTESASQKIRSIYFWIGSHIAYDVEMLTKTPQSKSNLNLAEDAFQNKEAICQGYSALFDLLCKKNEIPSFIIHGYVKQDGKIMEKSHSWNAAFIDDKWRLFDPTWSAGYVTDNQFVKRFTYDYYDIAPSESIKSRMPFDPVWQLLAIPVSHNEFIHGSPLPMAQINFQDSIQAFMQMDTLSQLVTESRRVLAAGLVEPKISEYYQYLTKHKEVILSNMEIDKKNEIIHSCNAAADHYNQAVKAFNEYIHAKNHQFRSPTRQDDEIRQMISDPDVQLSLAENIASQITSTDPQILKIIHELSSSISELRKAIDQEKAFVLKYCKTPKPQRLNLFRVPVNKSKNHR